jgi:nucleoid DNA-binding protein
MNLTELSVIVAEKTNLDVELVQVVTDALVQAVIETLSTGEEVKIRNLGRLFWRAAAARKIRNPNTGNVDAYPVRYKLDFKPSQSVSRRE